MQRRRALYAFLSVLALFLVGTVVVLSSVTYYLAIDPQAYLTEHEVPILPNTTRWNPADHGRPERIERIIHQTWKTEQLPAKWRSISQACRDMMPDYKYMLWTDAGSRDFLAQYYPWFLPTFDNYPYPIQRADAIRYFVLYHYGGIYVDLDIGCLRPLDPLLSYPVILPRTKPVGVSNDLMFAQRRHPFFKQTIYNLPSFDHSWLLNYPTVMFSTGPMFLSAQYGLYTTSNPDTALSEIRILPKSLYGKNAREDEAPHSFFTHFYGSSWHAQDASFIVLLGTWGKALMWIGLLVLIYGLFSLRSKRRRSFRSGYEIVLPRLSRSGRWHFHLGRSSYSSSTSSTRLPSPISSTESISPIPANVPLLHLPFDQDLEDYSDPYAGRTTQSPLLDAFHRVRNRMGLAPAPREPVPVTPARPHRENPSRRGVLFFLPAVFATQAPSIELQPAPPPRATPRRLDGTPRYPPEKPYRDDIESQPESSGSGSQLIDDFTDGSTSRSTLEDSWHL